MGQVMQWIENLKRRWKNRMQKAVADTGLAREFKSVFELGGVPSFQAADPSGTAPLRRFVE